jgi:flagellar brake protein
MLQDTQPAAFSAGPESGGSDLDPLAPFRVGQALAIRALLSELKTAAATLHLVAPTGERAAAIVWAVDGSRQRLTLHPLGEHQEREAQAMVDAGEVTVVAYLDAIKLQFELPGLALIHGPGGVALQAELPSWLYRFQRRDSFRVRPLQPRGPQVRLRHPAMPEMSLSLRVLDFSLGGCALLLPDDVPALEPGTRLHGVQVHLDAQTLFNASLELKHASRFGPQQELGLRMGCAWQPETSAARASLQRCIEAAQRRRRHLGG